MKKKVKKKVKKKGLTITLRSRKPSQSAVLKLRNEAEKKQADLRKKEKPFIRYSFHIESVEVDGNNLLEEIVFLYKGTMVIPKSQKSNYDQGSYSVNGTYVVPHNIDHVVRLQDFKSIKRKDVIDLLLNNVREDYITGMRQMIHKELMPEYKIITELPWKS